MADFYLNYASYTNGELYCECLGIFTDEEKAIEERNMMIAQDRDDYTENIGEGYDKFIKYNTAALYEWDDDISDIQYRIQEIYG